MKPRLAPRPSAFTLVELAIVLSIMAVIALLALPSLTPMMQSYNLNRATGMVTDELTFARQAALTRNGDVEVRFYQTGPGNSSSDLQFRAVRSFWSATGQPLDRLSYLPVPIIISSSPQFSSLLDYTNPSRSGLSTGQETLPGNSGTTTYVSFLFRATGGTGLSPVTPPVGIWNLTLYAENAPANASTGLPNSYAAVQIDPVTGQDRTYRP